MIRSIRRWGVMDAAIRSCQVSRVFDPVIRHEAM